MTAPTELNFEAWGEYLIDLTDRYPNAMTINDLFYSELMQHIAAKAKVPQSGAYWETASFYGYAVAATARLLVEGVLQNFDQFRQLGSVLFGLNARRYLPSLFAAGLLHPSLDREYAETLLSTMTLQDLRMIDDEI